MERKKQLFQWPAREDILWIPVTDVICKVTEPVYTGKSKRMLKLLPEDKEKILNLFQWYCVKCTLHSTLNMCIRWLFIPNYHCSESLKAYATIHLKFKHDIVLKHYKMLLICFFVNVRYNFQSRLMFILYFLISLKLSNMTNYSLCYVHMHSGYLLYKVSDKAEILKCTLLLTCAFWSNISWKQCRYM